MDETAFKPAHTFSVRDNIVSDMRDVISEEEQLYEQLIEKRRKRVEFDMKIATERAKLLVSVNSVRDAGKARFTSDGMRDAAVLVEIDKLPDLKDGLVKQKNCDIDIEELKYKVSVANKKLEALRDQKDLLVGESRR